MTKTESNAIIRADITTSLALAASPTASTDGLREALRTMARYAGVLLISVEAAEEREATTAAQLATARAALHANRARELADTLSPPALDGAGEASER